MRMTYVPPYKILYQSIYILHKKVYQYSFISDGVANTGISDTEGLVEMIQTYKNKGIYLSTYGFGMGEYVLSAQQP